MISTPKRQSKALVLRDEIHGDMIFPPLVRLVIDHPSFQRLRRIRQLGLAEFVFPCASHTRFQHCLGASFLAGQYFGALLANWTQGQFQFNDQVEGTKFLSELTRLTVEEVASDAISLSFWEEVTQLSALLHDIGHGPWSHTFEQLGLKQNFVSNFSNIPDPIGNALAQSSKQNGSLHHEDISLLYVHKILKDIEPELSFPPEVYFSAIATLIHRKLLSGPHSEAIEVDLQDRLSSNGIKGGIHLHRLIRPMISGPFDVDRMDYIQRDGRNCGVDISGIEWRRIVNKLLPVLAEHTPRWEEPANVVLVSPIKNQHVLDDFIFTLFQMYAQVYMHPKIVGLEEIIRRLVQKKVNPATFPEINLEHHEKLHDESFRDLLSTRENIPELEKILTRGKGFDFDVARYPAEDRIEEKLAASGYSLISPIDRPMLKDSVGVFLHTSSDDVDSGIGNFIVRPWAVVSPIAQQFSRINYSPNFWLKCDWL